jgi:flavin reductase (DIM6/NTAB) family NADH-FMN oxidoreductase RutF
MNNFTRNDIEKMDKVKLLNLINSCRGYKSANLIVTKSLLDVVNIAVFSSVTHIGSNPPIIGFITRSLTVNRDTNNNLKENPFFTVNHITENIISYAHHTSAGYDENISEFDKTNLEKEYKETIEIPFVKNSPLQLLCKYVNQYHIAENDTVLIIATIENIFFKRYLLHKDYCLQFDRAKVVTINDLDGYALPLFIDGYAYANQKYQLNHY